MSKSKDKNDCSLENNHNQTVNISKKIAECHTNYKEYELFQRTSDFDFESVSYA